MIDMPLVQRVVLEALEGKIEALRVSNQLHGKTTIDLFFWDDLAEKIL